MPATVVATCRKRPARACGRPLLFALSRREPRRSHAIGDRVVPEAVEPLQGLVHLAELVLADAADLLDRSDVAFVEMGDHIRDFLALWRQADPNGAAVDARALVVD